MFRLSLILSAVHFCLAYGLRLGFRRTEEINPEVASDLARFAEKIEFVLTQPGRCVCEYSDCPDGSTGFWIAMVATSILWGNVLAFILKTVFKTLFR